MAIRLEELYRQAKQTHQLQLIAGEGGLSNITNWVHMIEDENVAEFLRGNELVFTTGIGHSDPKWLTGFAQGLTHVKASGLVVNIGPYIDAVLPETIDYCRQTDLPLFTIPWHIRLVDVTRDFCRRIISSEQTEMSVSSAFKNAIFLSGDISQYRAQLERHGYNADWRYCTAVVSVSSEQDGKNEAHVQAVRFFMQNIINQISEKYSIFMQDNLMIIVFANFGETDIVFCIDKIVEYYLARGRGYKLHIGIGQNETGLTMLAKSFKQAVAVLRMAVKSRKYKIYYQNLGIYKILLSTEDGNVLHEIYADVLGRLADYDTAYNTDYMNTLKCYIENDASVQVVAKLTYMHRNTINYKLRKIKEITGCDIASIEDRLKIMLAFKIKDIL